MAKKPTYEELEQEIKELKASDRQKQNILDDSIDIMMQYDTDLNIIWANKKAADVINCSVDDIVGKKCHKIFIGQDIPCLDCPSVKAIKTGKIENKIIFQPGMENLGDVYWDNYAIPFKDSNGQITGVTEISRNITKNKLVEDALKQEKAFAESLIDTAQVIVLVLDTNGRIIRFNPYMEDISGYKLYEVKGKDWFSTFLLEKDHNRIKKLFKQAGDDIQTRGNVNSILTKSGREVLIEWSDKVLKDKNGKSIGLLAIGQDITERILMAETIKESQENYSSIMSSMDDAVYISTDNFTVAYMNNAMIERTGYDATGESCYKSIHGLIARCSWCVFDKIVQGESVNYEVESPKDGKSFNISSVPILHADKSVSKLSIYRDVSEFKKIELQLQQVQKMESIGILAGGIAHDFNNILFPIVGYTEMLIEDAPEGSSLKEDLNEIYIGALRARDLIKQILTFSRQEEVNLRLMKIQPVLKEALNLIRSSISKTIEIKENINPDCDVIKSDPTQIHQIIMNLCTNAYHAMEDKGGVMTVSLKEVECNEHNLVKPDMTPGVYACLTVADTGIGIDKEIISKIFDPFFTTKPTGKGTGMGLSVIHGIVKRMKGIISVHGEPGKGADFNVYFPIENKLLTRESIQISDEIQLGSEHIMLVDDEEMILQMQKKTLERIGYKVTTRISSVEALEAFRANPNKFDLVITDMFMPNLTGDKLATEMFKIDPGIPILLCTGFSDAISTTKAISLGIKGIVLKPIVTSDLSQKIRKALDDV